MTDPLIQQGNDAAKLAANANIPAGQAGSPWTAPISADSLAPTAPINLPPTPQPTVQEPAAPPTKTLDQYITDLTPTTEGKFSGQANDLLSSIQTLMPELKNKQADTIQAENSAGIPTLNTQLRALQNDLQNQYIELQRSQKNIMVQPGVTTAVATAQQRQDYENRSFDYNLGVAKANFLTGNIEAAQKQVDRAISLKYSPIEQEIQNKKDQLQLIAPFLNAEEAKIAKAQDRKLADEQQAIEEKKADAKTNLTVALQAGVKTPVVNQNGKFFNARTGETYATPADFFKAQGVSSFEEAYQKGLVTDVNVADLNLVAQAQAKYPDVTIPYNATPEEVAKIVQNSRIYKKETYIAPSGGSGGGSGFSGSVIGGGSTPVVDTVTDSDVANIIASRPGDGGYGDAYNAVAAKYGKETADQYDSWYKAVFNDGQSIDNVYQAPSVDISNMRSIDLSRLSTAANRIVTNYVKSGIYKVVSEGAPYLSRITTASQNPGSVSDVELLDSVTKLNTGGNQVTEAQVGTILRGRSLSDVANVWKQKLEKGGVLSNDQRQQLEQLAQATYKNYLKSYTPVYQQATAQLQAAGIPRALWTIPDWNKLVGQQQTASADTPESFTLPDGTQVYLQPDGTYK